MVRGELQLRQRHLDVAERVVAREAVLVKTLEQQPRPQELRQRANKLERLVPLGVERLVDPLGLLLDLLQLLLGLVQVGRRPLKQDDFKHQEHAST